MVRERVGAIIHKDNKILLVEEGDIAHWSIPGGGIEEGETHAQAMHREILEELGVVVTNMVFYNDFLGKNYFYGVDQIDHCSIIEYRGDIVIGGGIKSFGWFSRDALENKTIAVPADYRDSYIPQWIADGIL